MTDRELLSAAQWWLEEMGWETRHTTVGRLQTRRRPGAEWRYVTAHTPTQAQGLHYLGWTNEVIHVCRKDQQYDIVQELQRRSAGRSFAGVPILWVEGDGAIESWNLDLAD